ncbi:MAG: DUF1289 domain-containing protein [Oceanospirillaceae bacterium]|nr:DUF1289 domain-containing protein [Oceanospirillaceae bacterium]
MNDAQLIAQAEMSPCVGVCKMDQLTGWCFGCGRTDSEIKGWQVYQHSLKAELVQPLAERVAQLVARRRTERQTTKRANRRGARRSNPVGSSL